MRKLFKYAAWIAALVVVLVLAAFLYLRNADLSVYEERLESFVSDRTGYTLNIAGRFELHFASVTRVVAEDLTLQAPEDDADAPLLRAGHVTFAFDTWSILSDTFVVEELLVRDVDANLKATGEESHDPGGEVATEHFAIRRVSIERFDLSWTSPDREQPLLLVLEHLWITPDADDILDLDLLGAINELPLEATGQLGPWPNFVDGRDITANLKLGLGQLALSVDGSVEDLLALQGINAEARVAGPDMGRLTNRLGLPPFASGAFVLDAKVNKDDGDNKVRVEGNLGEIEVFADGLVDRLIDPERLAFDFQVGGPDSRYIAELLGVKGVPAEAFRVSGGLAVNGPSWEARGIHASVGENVITADGSMTIGRREDSAIALRAVGPNIAILEDMTGLRGIVPRTYDITATLRSDPRGVALQDVTALFDDIRIELDGVVTDEPGAAGTTLQAKMSGSELHDLVVLSGVPYLPAGPFEIAAQVDIERDRVRFANAEATVADLVASASGVAGFGRQAGRFDVTFDLEGTDAAQFISLDMLQPFAGEAFSVSGGLGRVAEDLELTDVRVDIGEYHAEADGTLSLSPLSNDSDLVFKVTGPSLERIGRMFDSDLLLDKPFDVSGEFRGTPSGFVMRDFIAHLGDNDIRGEFAADLTDKPTFSATLTSDYLDLRERLQALVDGEDEVESEEEQDTGDFLLSNKPFDGHRLNAADVEIDVEVGRLKTNALDVTDFRLGFRLRDGELHIDPFRMVEREGSLAGTLSLVPFEAGYSFSTLVEADRLHLGFAATEDQDLATLPPVSGKIELAGTGNSLHEIFAGSNGAVAVRQGAGEVKEFFAAILFRDVVLEALRTINPLRKEAKSRRLDCGIYEITVVDGVATFDQVAMQTNQLLFVATGNIDLETEKLNINFRAKPREGIGISLGTVANSFLGVRGTLQSPTVSIDPKSSATATGAAVATGGLSLLARGLFDRLSAEKSICEQPANR
ncbi:MAG TPA: hypothetical protein VLA11_07135 [Woeseiaceae bacterium]|nr:hypothetical protein [Woeseiaceae bacterium]